MQHSSRPGATSSQEWALGQQEPLCDWLTRLWPRCMCCVWSPEFHQKGKLPEDRDLVCP